MQEQHKRPRICPICKKELVSEKNTFYPFCSERCQTIDLGAWLDEKYVVPGKEVDIPPEK